MLLQDWNLEDAKTVWQREAEERGEEREYAKWQLVVADKDRLLADKDMVLADKDRALANKDAEIAKLKAQLGI